MLGVSKGTVVDIIRRFRTEERMESIPQTGRASLLTRRGSQVFVPDCFGFWICFSGRKNTYIVTEYGIVLTWRKKVSYEKLKKIYN